MKEAIQKPRCVNLACKCDKKNVPFALQLVYIFLCMYVCVYIELNELLYTVTKTTS